MGFYEKFEKYFNESVRNLNLKFYQITKADIAVLRRIAWDNKV